MTDTGRPRRAPQDRELRLWNVGRALALAFAAAVLAAASIFYSLVILLDFQEIDSTAKLDASTLFDLVKLSFGVVAGAGALVALVVAYRRQRVDEARARLDEDAALRDATRLHTERFTAAVGQLGDDSPAVRLGGAHALAGLADDAPDDSLRQTCIDVLCAYLQLPFTADPGTDPAHQVEHHRYLALRAVRHTILRLIGDHYRRPQGTHRSWQGCDLDLAGVTIDGDMNFHGATFSGSTVNFHGATFSGDAVYFSGATFSGSNVYFIDATFSSGKVSFHGATFSGGTVYFNGATFSGTNVSFIDATFSGSKVSFHGATFSSGTVHFSRATFSSGTVDFVDATFSGSTLPFDRAAFSGGSIGFSNATFSGSTVYFSRAKFSSGTVYYTRAAFSGDTVSFNDATFSGSTVYFSGAAFSGNTVSFTGATFSGGTVSFDGANGSAPEGLLVAVGTPAADLGTRVTLPRSWHSP